MGCIQWRSQPKSLRGPKNFWGAKVYDFRRITLFCLEKRLSKHKMTIFSKNLGGHGLFGPPWLRLWLYCFCYKLFRLGNDHSLFVAKTSITFLNLFGLGLA